MDGNQALTQQQFLDESIEHMKVKLTKEQDRQRNQAHKQLDSEI